MARSSATRADDVSGKLVATEELTDTDSILKDYQRIIINDASSPGNMAGVDGSGNLKVTGTVAVSGTVAVKPTDGTNAISKTFDLDTSGVTHEWNEGVSLRKSASGGSVELGTNTNPVRTDPTGTTTQPVSLAAHQSVNVDQANGTTIDTNSGVKSAGTIRVVLATDQPALTNKLLVTPDSVALPANQSVNVSQINGVTPLMGNGVTGTGSPRVTIASDNTAFTVNAAQSGTWTVQPGNTANTTAWKVDGSAVTQPVSIAATVNTSDAADGATASAVPSKAIYVGGNKAGNLVGLALDSSGNLNVNVAAGGASGGTSSSFGSAFPATGTAVGAKDSTGTNMAALNLDASGFLKVNVAAGGAAGTPASIKHLVSGGSTNATNVKASAGTVYGWSIFNNAAYPVYVKLYNNAGTPTVGTGVVQTIGVQAGTGREGSFSGGITFSTGIALSITKGIADSDATAVLANDASVDIFYV